jgi:hypothetical protein
LAATVNVNDPVPCPLGELPSASQPAPEDADQVQSRSVVTDTDPFPPVAPKLDGDAAAVTWQRGVVGAVTDVLVEEPHERPTRAASTAVTAKR